jgi:ATPase subunit of ABC transporter with duplicated ATPase domains
MIIAATAWQKQAILIINEPTNHFDCFSKRYLFDLLKIYRRIGLLTSHDRKFIDELCQNYIFIQPPTTIGKPIHIIDFNIHILELKRYMLNRYFEVNLVYNLQR